MHDAGHAREAGAAQTITEAPDGYAIPVNGAKFTPSVAGTYVFEYINVADKYYKIIKVQ